MATMRELITGSLRLINAVGVNESPTADDMDVSLKAFNGMLDSWSAERLGIFTINPYYFPLIADQQHYTLGSGGDWDIDRPMQIQQAYVSYGASLVPGAPAVTDPTIQLFHYDTVDNDNFAYEVVSGTDVELQNGEGGLYISPDVPEFGVGSMLVDGGDAVPFPTTSVESNVWTIEWAMNWPSNGEGHVGTNVLYDINYGGPNQITIKFNEYFGDNQWLISVSNEDFCFGWGLNVVANPDQWYQCALQIDLENDTFDFWIDGVNQFTLSASEYFTGPFALSYTVRRDSSNFNFNDPLYTDELRISNAALYASGNNYDPPTEAFPDPSSTPATDEEYVATPSTIDIPVELLNDAQYASIPSKAITSTYPVKLYDNGDFPLRRITVWPIPNQESVMVLWLWQPLANKDTLDVELNLPKGYERALRFGLAVELAPEFGKEVPENVFKIASEAKAMLKRLNSGPQVMVGDIALTRPGASINNYLIGYTIPN